mmetsp:Transcript_106950/g.297836  ORF Transcript_106950/g.297836 Transcript_106950/m.297836 type:complete len:162 (-) Transcript_106950:108-593(-)
MPRRGLRGPAADGGDGGQCYYLCRFCDRWYEPEKFSASQLQMLSEGCTQKSNPICRSCARVGLEPQEQFREPEVTSLPIESRYAFLMAICGEYEGVPALPADVTARIFSYTVCRSLPFIADRGDGTFRCTACVRDFPSFAAAQQHCQTSQRHVKALKQAAA